MVALLQVLDASVEEHRQALTGLNAALSSEGDDQAEAYHIAARAVRPILEQRIQEASE